MNISMIKQNLYGALMLSVMIGVGLTQAAEPVPAMAPLIKDDKATIEAADLQQDAMRIPTKDRAPLMSNPTIVKRMAGNLYLRRVLAKQAVDMGLDKRPDVATALALARDKVLSEARVSVGEGEPPSDAELTKMAEHEYNIRKAEFAKPEEVRVRHILIRQESKDAKQTAEALLKRIQAGEDFVKLAQEKSEDPGSKANGGDLGFFARGRMVKPFEEAAFALQNPGDISPLVETKFGWHILKLEVRSPAGTHPFEAVKDDLKNDIAAKILKQRRAELTNPIMDGMKYDDGAVEAFAAKYR
jgi:peptidyl-prolyl cis-trans isomerase C